MDSLTSEIISNEIIRISNRIESINGRSEIVKLKNYINSNKQSENNKNLIIKSELDKIEAAREIMKDFSLKTFSCLAEISHAFESYNEYIEYYTCQLKKLND